MASPGPILRYSVDERPPWPLAAGLGLQFALFVISGAVFLPIFLLSQGVIDDGQAAFLVSATLLTGGLSTAVQAIRVGAVGSGFLLFMGTSGAFFVATLDAIELAGIGFVAALSLIAAPTEVLIAWLYRFLRNVFTPTVGGAIVMCVAVTVIPLTIDSWQGTGTEQEGSLAFLAIGGVSVVAMIAMIVGAPARYRLWAPIVGLAAGCLVALATGDWHFTQTSDAAVVGFPIGEWEAPTFPASAEGFAVLGAFVIATLAGTFETVGDAIAVQKVSLRSFRKIDYDAVRGALNADALGNALAGIFCSTPNTTYSSPTGMIPIVGVASRHVGLWGAGVMIIMAFLPVTTGFVLDLPGPAIGGITFVSILLLFFMGMRIVVDAGIDGRSALIVSLAFWGGFAAERDLFFPGLMPEAAAPILGNAISTGSVIAVSLSLLFQLLPRRRQRWRGAANSDAIVSVSSFAQETVKRFDLTAGPANRLEVCLEELVGHLVEHGQADRTIRVEVTATEDELEVLVTDRSELEDVDMPHVPTELWTAEPDELEQLGLVLLSRMASRVSHTTISGWQYVTFTIDRQAAVAVPSE